MAKSTIKSPNSDQIWERWKQKNKNNRKFKKYYEPKGAPYDFDHITAAEYVQAIDKGVLVYYQKTKEISATKEKPKLVKATADKVEKVKFYEFNGKKIDKESWDDDKMVAHYSTLKQLNCSVCKGKGGQICEDCKGTGQKNCDNCSNGKVKCKKCMGTGELETEIEVEDDKGRTKTLKSKIKCVDCFGTGNLVCKKCGGSAKLYCKNCGGSGRTRCKKCEGAGSMFDYEIRPVPFREVSQQTRELFSSYKISDSIEKEIWKDLTDIAEEVGVIRVKDLGNVKKKFVSNNLGYIDRKVWKTVKKARKDIKKAEDDEDFKVKYPIYIVPLQVLECNTVKRKTYEIFSIGTEDKFKVYGDL